MAKELVQHIEAHLKDYPSKVFRVENNDGFLYRSDVQNAFKALGIEVANGTSLQQRVRFEMREPDEWLVLLSQTKSVYIEDIRKHSVAIEFGLADYLQAFHIPSIIDLDLRTLDKLLAHQPLKRLNKHETIAFIAEMNTARKPDDSPFDLNGFTDLLKAHLNEVPINWAVVSRIIATGLAKTIGKPEFYELYAQVNQANNAFQDALIANYHHIKNSNPVKKPRIVTRILDYVNFNFRDEKIAIVVVDGMAMWQYELLKEGLPGRKHEDVIYSWLPSITQLSRQAIFRGDTPKVDYRQAPPSEERLWRQFWKAKGCHDFEIAYQHEQIDLSKISSVSKLAIVFKDLDDKMHGSTDYKDLLVLTQNWFDRSKFDQVVRALLGKGFVVFLTTDHGNVESKGWRGLTGREKLGTNVSGSRSERHIEYSQNSLCQDFMANNPEMREAVVVEGRTIYFRTNMSFSNRESLVSHGGSHLLEVLIPFIEIRNDA